MNYSMLLLVYDQQQNQLQQQQHHSLLSKRGENVSDSRKDQVQVTGANLSHLFEGRKKCKFIEVKKIEIP